MAIPIPITVEAIDAVLPQTQCQQCGYAGCLPYAQAIVAHDADINQCPPGGVEGIVRLAALTGRAFKPFAQEGPLPKSRTLAVIDENGCIGCTLCIKACPVDAILGAAKRMHTVIAQECTGCELCLAPCPVDVIKLIPHPSQPTGLSAEESHRARRRFKFRVERLEREHAARILRLQKATFRSPPPHRGGGCPEGVGEGGAGNAL